jgi:hypothetical protein
MCCCRTAKNLLTTWVLQLWVLLLLLSLLLVLLWPAL